MKTFTKRAEVIEFLLGQGYSKLLVAACAREFMQYVDNSDNIEVSDDSDEGFKVVELTEEECISYYNDFMSYDTYEDSEGVWFDGDIILNANGSHPISGTQVVII